PTLQDRGMERADIGEMPVEAAARDAHFLCQRLGLQRRKATCCQGLEAVVEPVLRGKLIGHRGPPYTPVLTSASARPISIQNCMEAPMRDILLQISGVVAILAALVHGGRSETRIFPRVTIEPQRLRTL